MGRVQNKVAIITGAASGLGRASAVRLAQEGATVIVTDINIEQGEAVASDIPNGIFIRHDVTQEQSWIDLIDTVVAQQDTIRDH